MTPGDLGSAKMARDWMDEGWKSGFEFSQPLNNFENFESFFQVMISCPLLMLLFVFIEGWNGE